MSRLKGRESRMELAGQARLRCVANSVSCSLRRRLTVMRSGSDLAGRRETVECFCSSGMSKILRAAEIMKLSSGCLLVL